MKVPFSFFPKLLTNTFPLEKAQEREVAGHFEPGRHRNY